MSRYYSALAVVTAIGTYLLIVMGGVVRVSGSGLGCPDWPTCHGQLVPPLEATAIIEYTHRLLGALVSPLILATTLGAWLFRRRERGLLVAATLAPVLLAIQIVLGAIFVLLVVGAFLLATGAGYACVGFPGCNGAALPFGSSRLVDLHLTHRLLAYLVAGLVVAVLVQAWRGWRWL